MNPDWTLRPEGDAALLLAPAATGAAGRAAVLALHRALLRRRPAGVLDWIHAPDSLLALLDPLEDPTPVADDLLALARDAGVGAEPDGAGRLVELPVRFGGADGPDLVAAAGLAGRTPDDLVAGLTAAPMRVAALGGNALPILVGDGMPAVPRLPSPRPAVPAGSVGLAGDRACVYPVAMPGGWRVVGRTTTPLIDPRADPVGLLRAGDRVRLLPV